MRQRKQETFFGGTLILMGSGILVKLIGAFFSIPLANLYGADGNDIFISAYYVYTAMYVISSAGLPVAVSKMVAERRALCQLQEVRRIARVSMGAFVLLGAALSGAMLAFSGPICRLIGSSCREALLAVAPTVFFTCVVSAVRGYYQGMANMVPTAVSQIIEALGKLIFGLGLAYYLMGQGCALERVVAGAIGGVTLGTALSALYAVLYALRDPARRGKAPGADPSCRPAGALLRELIRLAAPITVGASVFIVSAMIDNFMVKLRLQEGCLMTDAAAGYTYGAYGYAVKLFNLPLTLVVSIGVSLLPAISAALAVKDRRRTLSLVESAFRLTGILAFPCAFGLAAIPGPILELLFSKQPEACAQAAPLLAALAPSVFFAAMVSVSNPVLQAMGRARLPVISMAAGAAVKAVCNYALVGIPEIGILGAPIATGICYLTMMLLNFRHIRRQGAAFSLARSFGKPLLAGLGMGVFVRLIWAPVQTLTGPGRVGALLAVLIVVGLAALFYLLLLAALRAMPREDVVMLPGGEKLAKILKIR